MKLDEVPWQIWSLLGGQLIAFVFAWGRALLTISTLKKDIVTVKEDFKQAIDDLKKENHEQNKTTSSMYDKVSATREDVAEIKGMLGSRVND
jgi:hypothetical protein